MWCQLIYLLIIVSFVHTREYRICELLHDLTNKHGLSSLEAAQIACGARFFTELKTNFQSNIDGQSYYGIFGISNCCDKECNSYIDDDIANDLQCTLLTGEYRSLPKYNEYNCEKRAKNLILDCFGNSRDKKIEALAPSTKAPVGQSTISTTTVFTHRTPTKQKIRRNYTIFFRKLFSSLEMGNNISQIYNDWIQLLHRKFNLSTKEIHETTCLMYGSVLCRQNDDDDDQNCKIECKPENGIRCDEILRSIDLALDNVNVKNIDASILNSCDQINSPTSTSTESSYALVSTRETTQNVNEGEDENEETTDKSYIQIKNHQKNNLESFSMKEEKEMEENQNIVDIMTESMISLQQKIIKNDDENESITTESVPMENPTTSFEDVEFQTVSNQLSQVLEKMNDELTPDSIGLLVNHCELLTFFNTTTQLNEAQIVSYLCFSYDILWCTMNKDPRGCGSSCLDADEAIKDDPLCQQFLESIKNAGLKLKESGIHKFAEYNSNCRKGAWKFIEECKNNSVNHEQTFVLPSIGLLAPIEDINGYTESPLIETTLPSFEDQFVTFEETEKPDTQEIFINDSQLHSESTTTTSSAKVPIIGYRLNEKNTEHNEFILPMECRFLSLLSSMNLTKAETVSYICLAYDITWCSFVKSRKLCDASCDQEENIQECEEKYQTVLKVGEDFKRLLDIDGYQDLDCPIQTLKIIKNCENLDPLLKFSLVLNDQEHSTKNNNKTKLMEMWEINSYNLTDQQSLKNIDLINHTDVNFDEITELTTELVFNEVITTTEYSTIGYNLNDSEIKLDTESTQNMIEFPEIIQKDLCQLHQGLQENANIEENEKLSWFCFSYDSLGCFLNRYADCSCNNSVEIVRNTSRCNALIEHIAKLASQLITQVPEKMYWPNCLEKYSNIVENCSSNGVVSIKEDVYNNSNTEDNFESFSAIRREHGTKSLGKNVANIEAEVKAEENQTINSDTYHLSIFNMNRTSSVNFTVNFDKLNIKDIIFTPLNDKSDFNITFRVENPQDSLNISSSYIV